MFCEKVKGMWEGSGGIDQCPHYQVFNGMSRAAAKAYFASYSCYDKGIYLSQLKCCHGNKKFKYKVKIHKLHSSGFHHSNMKLLL